MHIIYRFKHSKRESELGVTFFQGQAEVPTSHLRRCKARTEGNNWHWGKNPRSHEQWDFYGFYRISMGFL